MDESLHALRQPEPPPPARASEETRHAPVMVAEVVAGLGVRAGGCYVDATVGDGGHTAAIWAASGRAGRLLGLDRDAQALQQAAHRLGVDAKRCTWLAINFEGLEPAARAAGFNEVDGVLFDLGVRSEQLDRPERGFSFRHDGPLDMRMDRREARTAAEWVNESSPAELTTILRRYGEERAAHRIVRAITRRRAQQPFTRTADLAGVVAAAVGGRRGRIHPATRTFMALRMAVNRELEAIEAGLEGALALVAPGGRVAVLSYHSVEDRVVKRCFARHIGREEALQGGGQRWAGTLPRVRRVTRKPQLPTPEEVEQNPRSRSAKLRIVERMPT